MGALKPWTTFHAAPTELVPRREPFPINMALLPELSRGVEAAQAPLGAPCL